MNAEVKPARPPILRVLAWIAGSLLITGWAFIPFVFFGTDGNLQTGVFFWTQLGAFVIGLSSGERSGAISASLPALTLTLWLA